MDSDPLCGVGNSRAEDFIGKIIPCSRGKIG